jgi:hypothetical protein
MEQQLLLRHTVSELIQVLLKFLAAFSLGIHLELPQLANLLTL